MVRFQLALGDWSRSGKAGTRINSPALESALPPGDSQPECIQFYKTIGITLVIRSLIILEGDYALIKQRIRIRAPATNRYATLV